AGNETSAAPCAARECVAYSKSAAPVLLRQHCAIRSLIELCAYSEAGDVAGVMRETADLPHDEAEVLLLEEIGGVEVLKVGDAQIATRVQVRLDVLHLLEGDAVLVDLGDCAGLQHVDHAAQQRAV